MVSCWQLRWGNQHKDISTVSPARSLKPQNSASPCMILVISELLPPPWKPMVSVCEQNFVCWPFNSMPGFLLAFCLSPVDRIPDDLHSQMFHGLLFPAVVLWVEEPGGRLRSPCPKGVLYSWNIALDSQPLLMYPGAFHISVPHTGLDVASLCPQL